MAIKTVIFDLDGTLVNSLADLAEAGNAALRDHGFNAVPTDTYRFLLGSGARAMMSRATAAAGSPVEPQDARIDALLATFNTYYDQNWHEQSAVYPGIPELIRRLSASGLKLAVLSNKPDPFTQQVVRWFFPDHPFAAVHGLQNDSQAKPNPELALMISRSLDSQPKDTVFVGDAATDMKTAVRSGMYHYGVLRGIRDRQELLESGAVRLFDSADDLTRQLLADAGIDSI